MQTKLNNSFLIKSDGFVLEIQECICFWRSVHDSPSDYSSGDYRYEFNNAEPRYVIIKDAKGCLIGQWSRSLYFYLKPFKSWLNEFFEKEQCDRVLRTINEKAQYLESTQHKESSFLELVILSLVCVCFLLTIIPIALLSLGIASCMSFLYFREKEHSLVLESPKIWEDSIMLMPHDEIGTAKKLNEPKHQDLESEPESVV